MIYGYARVSTLDQNPDLQLHALHDAGCDEVLVEHASGGSSQRPVLARLMASLGEGDTLTVWKLDRLARSLTDLLRLSGELEAKGAHLVSLNDPIDTTSAYGRFTFQLLGALAELERGIVRERTAAGLEAAKRRGAKLGRRPKLTPADVARARKLIEAGERTADVARTLKVGRTTLYAALKER